MSTTEISECPVCLSSSPEEDRYGHLYIMCPNGHHACSACYHRMKTCPICRSEYNRASPLSNDFLESWSETEDEYNRRFVLKIYTETCAHALTTPGVKFVMCRTGHSVCLCCHEDEEGVSCAECGESLEAPYTRNLALEQALDAERSQCRV